MPASKYAHTRYQVINSCLTSKVKKVWTTRDLLLKLKQHDIAVSKRTLHTDIETMRFDERLGYYAPIVFNKLRGGFYYDKDDYSINTFALSQQEVYALIFAREFIRPFLHLSALHKFESLFNKLMGYTQLPSSASEFPIIAAEVNFGCDHKLVDLLLSMIHEKIVCRIAIVGLATGKTEQFFFHPYCLHLVAGTWYFGGLIQNDLSHKTAFFELRQLKAVVATHHEFIGHEI